MGFSALLHVYFPFTLLHVYLTVYLTVARTANWSIRASEPAAMLALSWAFTRSSSAPYALLHELVQDCFHSIPAFLVGCPGDEYIVEIADHAR
uniref:Putative secreted protein n=1 Tax=Ixodes ricinus TaxID=34613 RepID=A0A6B0U2D7_IXORI